MTQKKQNTKRKGFTLIELIVVLAILGILAAIAVPNFTAIQEDAKLKADKATAQSILKAARLQHFSDGKADSETIGTETANKTDAKTNEDTTGLKKSYFDGSDVIVQSKHYVDTKESKNTEDKFYLVALDEDGTGTADKTEYGVLWMTEKNKGKIVVEGKEDIYDVLSVTGAQGSAIEDIKVDFGNDGSEGDEAKTNDKEFKTLETPAKEPTLTFIEQIKKATVSKS